jgi:NAD+ diphosphatase
MIGAIAQTIADGEEIVLKHDPELEHARWASFEEVSEALKVGTSGLGEPAGEGTRKGT